MKKNIIVGNKVDDGTGTFLRDGGTIINDNFNEVYGELGDGANLHPAGAWESIQNTRTINAKFGKSYAVNTRGGKVTLQLPKGSASNFAEVIRIRDVWGSWASSFMAIKPAQGDTIQGSSKTIEFKKGWMDLEFVYCSPGTWKFVSNKQVDRISNSDLATVARKEFIITKEGQTDFLDIFKGDEYNVNNTTVHWRGNLLTYGSEFDKNVSDFGSPGKKAGEIIPLDGLNIRLKYPTSVGDTVTITSYLDGIAAWRATYERANLRIIDRTKSTEETFIGQTIAVGVEDGDRSVIDMKAFDIEDKPNPNSFEITLNGLLLTRVGTIGANSLNNPPKPDIDPISKQVNLNDMYSGVCYGAFGVNKTECELAGGNWQVGIGDYYFEFDSVGFISKIFFNLDLKHDDVIAIRWYNNNVGTTMKLSEILLETDDRYVNSGSSVKLTNRIEYDTYDNNPTQKNVKSSADLNLDSMTNVLDIFDRIYPIGTIYENAHNPANPVTYMGFGRWVRYAEGLATVGWDSSPTSALFHKNNNDLDQNGNMRSSAGGTVGTTTTKIDRINLPSFKVEGGKPLVEDPDGDVIVGGCLDDPNETNGPGYKKFRVSEMYFGSQTDGYEPKSIDIVQPSITVYKWLRVE